MPKKRVNISSIIGKTILGFFIITVLLFIGIIVTFFLPHYYYTFDLNDPKGVYIVNYDGDYWLTYYLSEQVCININGIEECKTELVKKANTSITYSPVELDQFLQDKPVHVTGSFVSFYTYSGRKKEFCIKAQCKESTGPGLWYASPLKIDSIQLDTTH